MIELGNLYWKSGKPIQIGYVMCGMAFYANPGEPINHYNPFNFVFVYENLQELTEQDRATLL
jgi:hypothetical protein